MTVAFQLARRAADEFDMKEPASVFVRSSEIWIDPAATAAILPAREESMNGRAFFYNGRKIAAAHGSSRQNPKSQDPNQIPNSNDQAPKYQEIADPGCRFGAWGFSHWVLIGIWGLGTWDFLIGFLGFPGWGLGFPGGPPAVFAQHDPDTGPIISSSRRITRMSELWTTVERFRLVKNAYHDFITLWALDCALEQPSIADRICNDVMTFKDSRLFDRSDLYRPGGLDD